MAAITREKPMGLRDGALLTTVLVLLCVDCKRDQSVSERIAEQLRAGATKVDVGQLARFDWDQLFVFGPYDYPKAMCDAIEISPMDCSWTGFADVDEGEFVLVFMNGRKIAHRENFPRFIGDFDQACLRKKVAKSKARFTVDKKTGVIVLRSSE